MSEKQYSTLSIIGKDATIVPYRRELAILTGTTNSAILLSQILYWAEKMGNEPFFKYKEPPQQKEGESDEEYFERVSPYKEGDSWTEELYFTKEEFDSSLSRIAHNKNKGMTEEEYKTYPIKRCIHYWTTRDRKTYYEIKEPEILSKLINSIFLNKKFQFRKAGNSNLDIIQRLLTDIIETIVSISCTPERPRGNENDNQENPPDKQNNKASELRKLSKDQKQIQRVYSCPKTVQSFMDLWIQYTGRKYRKGTIYEEDCKAVHRAMLGNFFNSKDTPTVDKQYYGTKLDIDDWEYALKRFSLIRNNADYFPKNKINIRNLCAKSFLYNSFSNFKMKSYFITCLESEPKLISASVKTKSIPDLNPELTDSVIEKCKQVFGWDMNNGKRHLAIQTVNRLNSFFETEKPKILHYDIHYRFFNQRLDALVKMLEANESPEYPAQPSYLCGNITYNDRLPKYLKEVRAYRT